MYFFRSSVEPADLAEGGDPSSEVSSAGMYFYPHEDGPIFSLSMMERRGGTWLAYRLEKIENEQPAGPQDIVDTACKANDLRLGYLVVKRVIKTLAQRRDRLATGQLRLYK